MAGAYIEFIILQALFWDLYIYYVICSSQVPEVRIIITQIL